MGRIGWLGLTLAMTKLKSHWVIRAAAIVRERMWLGCVVLAMGSVQTIWSSVRTHCALRAQDEWNWSPSERVEDDKEVYADDCERRIAVKRLALDDWVDGLVDA
jgi:hypothetical protein